MPATSETARNMLEQLVTSLRPLTAPPVAVVVVAVLLWGAHRLLLLRAGKVGETGSFQRQLVMIALTARAALNAKVLDVLHRGGIEIMSPTCMTQRQLPPGVKVVPQDAPPAKTAGVAQPTAPEDLIFDKAEEAEQLERLQKEREEIKAAVAELEKQLHDAQEPARPAIESELSQKRDRLKALDGALKAAG